MKRRTFLKSSAMLGLAGLVSPAMAAKEMERTMSPAPGISPDRLKLQFRPDGKYKILQLTDTHYVYGDERSKRAMDNVNYLLDTEKPDLVIHTGDVVYGAPAEDGMRTILEPISRRKIPFAVAFGNHDSDFDKSRKEMNDVLMSLPYNLNTRAEGIYGETNCALKLYDSKGKGISRVFYLFDSNSYQTLKDVKSTYGYIHFDQIGWYRQLSAELASIAGGKPVPSLAFFHIPLLEHKEAFKDESGGVVTVGTRGEGVASPAINSGLFVSMKEMGDVKAVFVGHDHNSDYVTYWNNMFFVYGRYSGCDTVYNDLKPNGGRVIELTEGDEGFRSWIRLSDGSVIQDLKYPESFIQTPE